MNKSLSRDVHQTAIDCISEMGDIFWDYDAGRDAAYGFRDPYEIAVEAVEKTLCDVVFDARDANHSAFSLKSEYDTLIAELPEDGTDEQIIGALVANADWTDTGAREILVLARRYGTSSLRNALALADALRIEDGDAGF
jgi:hypothetical protein